MENQTNSAPSVPQRAQTWKFCAWNSEMSVPSASTPTVSLKNLLFKQFIKKWNYTVNVTKWLY